MTTLAVNYANRCVHPNGDPGWGSPFFVVLSLGDFVQRLDDFLFVEAFVVFECFSRVHFREMGDFALEFLWVSGRPNAKMLLCLNFLIFRHGKSFCTSCAKVGTQTRPCNRSTHSRVGFSATTFNSSDAT